MISNGRAILSAEVHTNTGEMYAKLDLRPSITEKQFTAMKEHFLVELEEAFVDLWREIKVFQDRDPY